MNINFLTQNILYFTTEKNNYLAIETFLINFCFLVLFITTMFYWIKFIFYPKKQSTNFGLYGLYIANFSLFIQLCLRWLESGHFPLSNLYDSLLFLAWGLLFIFIFLENFTKLDLLGIIISPTILCIIAFTDFSLPEDLQKIKPLVPALQSNWLFMHVTVMIFSYAALILGSLLSISYIFYFYYLNNCYYPKITLVNMFRNLTSVCSKTCTL
jgi:ABC-type transport system involved in cytochrome c biogenesis permease subunit